MMTEDEIMARAIQAEKQRMHERGWPEQAARIIPADDPCVGAAAIALRNLSIPLSEILPEDPDEREAWEIICAIGGTFFSYENRIGSVAYTRTLAAIKRGRELAGEGK
jgi:hypothetical protein